MTQTINSEIVLSDEYEMTMEEVKDIMGNKDNPADLLHITKKYSRVGKYSISLRVIGNDDIGIVNNLTSIISKDEKLVLRSINIDSHDGLFSGNLVVMLEDTSRLEALIKKLRTVKGVKQVERI